MMKVVTPITILAATALMSAASAQVKVSIAVRETGFAGGAFSNVGGDGGASGGIEWVNLDGHTLVLDGTWQKLTFDLAKDPITKFAGTSANGVLEGDYGTLEHIRILNSGGRTDPITIHVDDISNTTNTLGTVVFGDFEGYAGGTEVMFQEPGFSGSTSSHVAMGSTSGVDNFVASRSASCRFDWQFVDGTPTRWVRLTTFNATNQRNPLIRFDNNSVVELWIRGGDCQENLGSQGPGGAFAEICGTGLNAGESSTLYVAGAQAGAPGAIGLSIPGQIDIPIFGGTLVSGAGLVLGVSVSADANGNLAVPLPGQPNVGSLVLQSVFVDGSTASGFGLTNAILAKLGQ